MSDHPSLRPFPDLTIDWWFVAFKNLMHPLAVLCGFVAMLTGYSLTTFSPGKAVILLVIGLLFLIIQVTTRSSHIQAGLRLRFRWGQVQLNDPQTGLWKSIDGFADQIVSISRDYYPFADPWRPFTLGYFGISIELRGVEKPVLHLLPWGLEALRDDQYEWLLERFPGLKTS